MSYLIALYVYYHGNNLAVFGITKGARDEDLDNKGLKRPEEINPDLVDQQLIKSAQEEEEKQIETDKELNWNDILRSSIQKAQKMTYELQHSGMVNDTIFESTPDSVVDTYEDEGSIPLDFFSSINGF